MATKKQQRRRQKERRHEYEEVWVDSEGNEIDYEPSAAEKPKADGKAKPAAKGQPAKSRSGRPMREIKPPSWQRVSRRALILAPLLFVALSFGKHPSPVPVRLLISVGYTALFVPTFYWIDRLAYRRYLRATGQPDPARKR
jgi:hypothetical protein